MMHLGDLRASAGIVLGSGLGAFADSLPGAVRIPYSAINGFPPATAVGHKGELVVGSIGGLPVAVMSGRFHLYEGYSAREVSAGIRLFHSMGVRRVVLTNAAGGINPKFKPGSLVLISDHINLQGANPLQGLNDEALGPRFPDMTEAYSPRLRAMARRKASELDVVLEEGVYAGLAGPSYETPPKSDFCAP